jgi:hypothetical protein
MNKFKVNAKKAEHKGGNTFYQVLHEILSKIMHECECDGHEKKISVVCARAVYNSRIDN